MRKELAKTGFTLIELLVVVLIIGILASVALPQYQAAVEKSRAATVWPILKAINEAQLRKNMEEGTSAKTYPLAELDLGFDNINHTDDGSVQDYITTQDFNIGLVRAAYYGYATTEEPAAAHRINGSNSNNYILAIRNGKKTCAGGNICKKIVGSNTAILGVVEGCLTGDGNCFTE